MPAFASYRPATDGSYRPFAIQVIEIADGHITGLHAFLEPRLFPLFEVPNHLSAQRDPVV
jgi:RNA polymerase sigma-70 factor (ECF subfamily)